MKENMKRKIAVLLTLLGVTSIVIGTTFAIYENTINTNKNHIIKTGVVNFTLTESTNGIVLNNLQELTDYEGMAQEEYYEFTLKNTGNTITDYEISLVDKPNSSYTGTILNEKYIKVGLLKNNSEEIIVNLKEVNRLIDKVTLDVDKSANYKLRLWLDLKDITDEKYYNNYTGSSYTGHTLTETAWWYSDNAAFVEYYDPWFNRGGYSIGSTDAGVFSFSNYSGNSSFDRSSRPVISNE